MQFLVEKKINENSTILLSNFSYYLFHFVSKKTPQKFGGIFGTKVTDGVRECSGNETLKNFKVHCYETRLEVAIVVSPGWILTTQTEIPALQEITKNSNFLLTSMTYLEH